MANMADMADMADLADMAIIIGGQLEEEDVR
jgi:hypothetical protein